MARPIRPYAMYQATVALAVASVSALLCASTSATTTGQPLPFPSVESPAIDDDTPQAAAALQAVVDLEWHDASRDRRVPVRLYWPAARRQGETVPLIVFSHGIGGSRAGYGHLGRYWAEHGYASLHVQHVGSDHQIWRGNVFTLPGRLQRAADEREALARVADLHFALDRLLAGERGPHIDASRIVAAGHSYGAMTAMLAAGARVERGGQVLPLRDARLRAAILMSAPPFYGETDLGPILREVSIPTLHLTTTEDVIRVPGYHSPPADRLRVFEATGSSLKVLAIFQGGSHSVFIDRRGSGDLPRRIRAATGELSVNFLQRVFDRDGGAGAEGLAVWPRTHQGVLASFRMQ